MGELLGHRRAALRPWPAASICAASDSRVASSSGRPTIWTASGRPDAEKPAGTDAAGWPVAFQRTVNGTHPVSHW